MINTLIMGENYTSSILAFGPTTIKSLTIYAHSFIIPNRWGETIYNPLHLLLSIPIIILAIRCVKESWKQFLYNSTFAITGLLVAIGPLVNTWTTWYLYYPSTVFAFLFVNLLFKDNGFTKILFAIIVLFNSFYLLNNALEVNTAGKIDKQILKEVAAIPSDSLRLISIPSRYYGGAQFIALDSFLPAGIRAVYNRDMFIEVAMFKVVNRAPKSISFQKLNENTGKYTDSILKPTSFFILYKQGTSESQFTFKSYDKAKMPNSVLVEWRDEIPTYIAKLN